MENMKPRIVIVEKNDSRKNERFEFDSYYKAWATYYHYKEKIGYGKTWDDVIINVRIE